MSTPQTLGFRKIVQTKFLELFSIDLRSLALFRIALGLLIFLDAVARMVDARAFLSDSGLLPRAVLLENFSNPWYFSFYFMNGNVWFQVALLTITALLALLLLLGYRTRLVTFLTWLLVISLHSRNPVILQGSDVLLRALLFWAMFLPLGAYYSLDRALDSEAALPKPKTYFSIGSMALLLQVAFVYWFTAALKYHPAWWVDGIAIYQALSIDQFSTALGKFLLNFPNVLRILTFVTIGIEILAPTLAFFPFYIGRIRVFIVFLMIGLHLSFGACMALGPFPWVSSASWLVFLPSGFWDRLLQRLKTEARKNLVVYYDGDCGFCKKSVLILKQFFLIPETTLLPSRDSEVAQKIMQEQNSWVVFTQGRYLTHFAAFIELCRLSPLLWIFVPILRIKPVSKTGESIYRKVAHNRMPAAKLLSWLQYRPMRIRTYPWVEALLGALLLYVFLWNVRSLNFQKYQKFFPRQLNPVANTLRIDQYWNMFSPKPLTIDGWYIIVGTLQDGSEVDLFNHGRGVYWEKPNPVARTYANHRWRKYMMNLRNQDYARHRPYYAKYLCQDWNRSHFGSSKLQKLQINFMQEETLPYPKVAPIERKMFLEYECSSKS